MKSVEFCYWLQGYFELAASMNTDEGTTLTPQQVQAIRNHLNMVFKHEIDPSYPKKQQQALSDLHGGQIMSDPTQMLRC